MSSHKRHLKSKGLDSIAYQKKVDKPEKDHKSNLALQYWLTGGKEQISQENWERLSSNNCGVLKLFQGDNQLEMLLRQKREF